jgi:selenocysteine lyase/cysteine desulfurase
MATAFDAAYTRFLAAWRSYAATQPLDDLRARDYRRLDERNHVYLDYTGAGLYAERQLRQHLRLLQDSILGNPHSTNPSSLASTHLDEQARQAVLTFFDAPSEEYVVIWTANASGALKLVGESYPFEKGGRYLLTFDNHNSVNGIREFARSHGAKVTYVPMVLPDMRVDEGSLAAALEEPTEGHNSLFAYPAQSNFSGVQHPLEWIARAQACGWDVLLDAAAFVPTNRLDLRRWRPDFVPVSFYKMFGYPTGVGALMARRAALAKLRRPWFAGGTITVASVQGDRFYMAEGAHAFEDGTLNYLSLPAVALGLHHLEAVGLERIHERVRCLTGWLLDALNDLRHSNGSQLVRIYGPLDTTGRGGTVTMNFFDPQGYFFDHRRIEAAANEAQISLRTGCFCNPGGGEAALGISPADLAACFGGVQQRLTLDDFRLCIDGKSTGAVRVSVGLVSNFADVYRFLLFARQFLDVSAVTGFTTLEKQNARTGGA